MSELDAIGDSKIVLEQFVRGNRSHGVEVVIIVVHGIVPRRERPGGFT